DERTLAATPPYWRGDLSREADLIEEVARLDGVDRLPATLHAPFAAGGLSVAQRAKRRAEDVLVGRGLHEIAGWSFTDPEYVDRVRLTGPSRETVRVENPMSERESVMRPGLLGSLLDAAAHNLARGHGDLRLFESGRAYWPGEGSPAGEAHQLAAILVGRAATVLAVKGLVEAVFDTLRVPFSVQQTEAPMLHPGKAGAIRTADEPIGLFGEVHPLVLRAWDIELPVAAFMLFDLDAIAGLAPETTTFRDLTSFPALRQDIAVVVAVSVPAAQVVAVVQKAGGRLLESARVFDRYELGEGRVSLALHLEFRASDRTLTDEDVAPVRERIVAALRDHVGGELRG
ncbi:MAG: phenylalanine--tRNA ligase subunit beta, partial [Solirubrobacteraceae bacterium]|nr:phenylalanine--tRNA ligase subunit beta [Solirubrobacteraceae bacterium]